MAEFLKHITAEEIAQYGVVAAPDRLLGKAEDNKAVFDRLVRELVAVAVNKIIDQTNALLVAEDKRESQEAGRVEAETGRAEAEGLRVAAEQARAQAEESRTEAEKLRVQAETDRAGAESNRAEAEKARVQAEVDRVAAEVLRAQAEEARVKAEEKRQEAEGQRATAERSREAGETERGESETKRKTQEAERVKAEEERAKSEQARVQAEQSRSEAEGQRDTAEQGRKTQEAQRVKAEQERADETAGIVARASKEADRAEQAKAAAEGAAERAAQGAVEEAAVELAGYRDAAAGSAEVAGTSAMAAAGSAGTAKTEADRAKTEADRAAEIVGGDFPTKTEAQGYVNVHAEDAQAHKALLDGKADLVDGKVKKDQLPEIQTDQVVEQPDTPTSPNTILWVDTDEETPGVDIEGIKATAEGAKAEAELAHQTADGAVSRLNTVDQIITGLDDKIDGIELDFHEAVNNVDDSVTALRAKVNEGFTDITATFDSIESILSYSENVRISWASGLTQTFGQAIICGSTLFVSGSCKSPGTSGDGAIFTIVPPDNMPFKMRQEVYPILIDVNNVSVMCNFVWDSQYNYFQLRAGANSINGAFKFTFTFPLVLNSTGS